jgi:hypothetical protein
MSIILFEAKPTGKAPAARVIPTLLPVSTKPFIKTTPNKYFYKCSRLLHILFIKITRAAQSARTMLSI